MTALSEKPEVEEEAEGRTISLQRCREDDLESVLSGASSAVSEAEPMDFRDLVQIYSAVADRRSSFDILLCFAAHAFLFTTALAGDSARVSRLISMALSLLISFLTIHLFTRHLAAEDADRRWLDDWEMRHNLDDSNRSHGAKWSEYQSSIPDPAKHFELFTRASAFTFWSNGMLVMGFVAAVVLVMASTRAEKYLEQCGGRNSA